MATVCCRALYVVKWYEISRVLTVSSTLVTTKNYRNETWCKRWWHFSQRNFSTTRSYFAPNLSPIFAKGMENICTKEKKSKSTKDDKAEKQLVLDKTDGGKLLEL
ncbi:hypothetical protein APICC_02440 [Apis cerana cerana]|uniref:Uncharacterized protein n=1 Tax=Apis cerana cerana TaxID=94128 RepID=A0A2A3EEX3_APICC|nr:hypothetical protein APICC_02440 [Apis cerana cerana]